MVKFLKQRVNCDIFAGHCRIRWFSVDFWVRWPLGIESQNSETPIALKPKCNGWPPSVKWCDGYHRPSLDASHSVSVSVRRIFVLQTLGDTSRSMSVTFTWPDSISVAFLGSTQALQLVVVDCFSWIKRVSTDYIASIVPGQELNRNSPSTVCTNDSNDSTLTGCTNRTIPAVAPQQVVPIVPHQS